MKRLIDRRLCGVVAMAGALSLTWSADREPAQPGHRHGPEHSHEARFVKMLDTDFSEVFLARPGQGGPRRLTYRLAEPARVNIRIKKLGTRELFLATVVNWEFRDAGRHTEYWNGRDYSGNPVDMAQATLIVLAEKAVYEAGSMPLDEMTAEQVIHGEKLHKHGTHHAYAEEVPLLEIVEPSPDTQLRGTVLIRSQVDPERRGYGDKYGYGVRYYVDGVLAHEEFYAPESNGSFAYRLDTTAFGDGKHTLYVGMCDHHQHATSAGVSVVFSNGG